jgi:hypothetical protein
MLVRAGGQLWTREGRIAGFPRQGVYFNLVRSLEYASLNVGISRLRCWVFLGWGWRWPWGTS